MGEVEKTPFWGWGMMQNFSERAAKCAVKS